MFNLGAFLSYVLVVTFTPGPNNIMCMSNASKFGYKKTLNLSLGVGAGFFIVMMLSSYFNLLLFNLIPKIKTFMSIFGAIYMIYLATKIMKSKEQVDKKKDKETTDEIAATADESSKNNLNLFFAGVAMQFVNPKGIIYSITVVSNFIIPHYKSNTALFLFSFLLAFISFMSTTSWHYSVLYSISSYQNTASNSI